MFKDYHIIIVPKNKSQTKTLKVSGFTLKVLAVTAALCIPLFIIAILSAIHFQNKLVAMKRTNYENHKLIENRNELVLRLSKLEKSLTVLDDSILHLSELMDIDPQSIQFGTGPIADLDLTLSSAESGDVFSIPGADAVIDEWVENNGQVTSNKIERKINSVGSSMGLLNKKLEEIFSQKKDKISYITSTPSLIPVQGWVTSDFGVRRHPITRAFKMHNGIDIASPMGTDIVTPASGKVLFAGRSGGYGKTVIIQHGYGITTMYAHLKSYHVKTGQTLTRGDKIAEVGSTGHSTGPHLHYEVQVDGIPVDPMDFVVN